MEGFIFLRRICLFVIIISSAIFLYCQSDDEVKSAINYSKDKNLIVAKINDVDYKIEDLLVLCKTISKEYYFDERPPEVIWKSKSLLKNDLYIYFRQNLYLDYIKKNDMIQILISNRYLNPDWKNQVKIETLFHLLRNNIMKSIKSVSKADIKEFNNKSAVTIDENSEEEFEKRKEEILNWKRGQYYSNYLRELLSANIKEKTIYLDLSSLDENKPGETSILEIPEWKIKITIADIKNELLKNNIHKFSTGEIISELGMNFYHKYVSYKEAQKLHLDETSDYLPLESIITNSRLYKSLKNYLTDKYFDESKIDDTLLNSYYKKLSLTNTNIKNRSLEEVKHLVLKEIINDKLKAFDENIFKDNNFRLNEQYFDN